MKNYETLPPVIRDLIDHLREDKTPPHVKDVYAQRLENIVECGSAALLAYKAQPRNFRRKRA